MYKTRFLVDTDVIINYLKGREIARDFLMKIFDESVSGFEQYFLPIQLRTSLFKLI
ncbi:MAG: hypothetical protein U9N40_00055 [Euryarchaeota archaeon]|nr:hypothetical protein [Euryarchaeota archaeon]